MKDEAFEIIRDLPILQTQSTHFLRVLEAGTVTTNVFLRSLRGTKAMTFRSLLKPVELT